MALALDLEVPRNRRAAHVGHVKGNGKEANTEYLFIQNIFGAM
jgi:hypothetical protein